MSRREADGGRHSKDLVAAAAGFDGVAVGEEQVAVSVALQRVEERNWADPLIWICSASAKSVEEPTRSPDW